eukprot:471313_1
MKKCDKQKLFVRCSIFSIIVVLSCFLYLTDIVSFSVQYKLDVILSNMENRGTNHIAMNENITILIGLSPAKSTSSLTNKKLTYALQEMSINQLGHTIFETRYWDRCIFPSALVKKSDTNKQFVANGTDCNFDDYLRQFEDFESKYEASKHGLLLIHEKSPPYFMSYHTSYLLSYYAHEFNIFFYIGFRHPIQRLLSIYYMKYGRFARNSGNESQYMINLITNDFNSFQISYPSEYKCIKSVKITAEHPLGKTDEKFEKGVINNWIHAYYDFMHHINYQNIGNKHGKAFSVSHSLIAGSCYYPKMLMWLKTFSSFNNQLNNVRFVDRFRVYRSEWVFEDENGMNNVLAKLLLWIDQQSNHNQNTEIINQWHQNKQPKTDAKNKHKHFDILNTEIGRKLNEFLKDCNQRLYFFLNQYPQILLFPDRTFDFEYL